MSARKGGRPLRAKRRTDQDQAMNQPINLVSSDPGFAAGKQRPDDLQVHIGRQLRAMYDTVVRQPIPERFLELLGKLDEKNGGKKDQG